MVTIELALAGLGAVAMVALLAWVLSALMLWGTCQDLATGVARQEARGDAAAVAEILEHRPPGAQVDVRRADGRVVVQVDLAARPWAEWLPSIPLHAEATVIAEPA
ncbi:MAG: hypothetical protein LWW77_01255 [Propionibacteriales bacterium]|nr:hypothetical protein [Propionibacteriales bacterium]